MSLYADYLLENYGFYTLEDERYFVTFYLEDDEEGKFMQIRDLYIHPDYRGGNLLARIGLKLRRIARNSGCVRIECSVSMDHKDRFRAERHIRKWGFSWAGEIELGHGILYERSV